jgi:hypothetical protein
MDSARALGIMGFSSTRWMDASTGMDPKEALDKALSDQMQNISQKKKQAIKERVNTFEPCRSPFHQTKLVSLALLCLSS